MSKRARGSALIALLAAFVLGACADTATYSDPLEGPWTPAPDIPTRAELTCATDGTSTLSTATLQPRPDGIHLRVNNEFDEPVSVEGFDADPGVTDWVFSEGPGTMELMCWPFSQHESGNEPTPVPLEIVDPLGLYVDGLLPCEITSVTTVERVQFPTDKGPPPLDIARKVIDGLQPDDILRVEGYPEEEGASVIVIRDDEIVGAYGITRYEGKPWDVSSGSACEGTGLPYEGESYG
jgi:hypothetical protein